jgi:hypothetical protein
MHHIAAFFINPQSDPRSSKSSPKPIPSRGAKEEKTDEVSSFL